MGQDLADVRADPSEERVRKVEVAISMLLRTGVLASLLIVLLGIGIVVTFVHHPHCLTSSRDLVRLTTPGAEFPRSLPSVIQGLEHS